MELGSLLLEIGLSMRLSTATSDDSEFSGNKSILYCQTRSIQPEIAWNSEG